MKFLKEVQNLLNQNIQIRRSLGFAQEDGYKLKKVTLYLKVRKTKSVSKLESSKKP